MKQATAIDPSQVFISASVLPSGGGGFVVQPRKPVAECGSKDAAQILGISRSGLSNLLREPLAKQIIRWRWTSSKMGKRSFDVGSLHRFIDATRDPEFGSSN